MWSSPSTFPRSCGARAPLCPSLQPWCRRPPTPCVEPLRSAPAGLPVMWSCRSETAPPAQCNGDPNWLLACPPPHLRALFCEALGALSGEVDTSSPSESATMISRGRSRIPEAGDRSNAYAFKAGAYWQVAGAWADPAAGSAQVPAKALDAPARLFELRGRGRIGNTERRAEPEGRALYHRNALGLEQLGDEVLVVADHLAGRRGLADRARAERVDVERT